MRGGVEEGARGVSVAREELFRGLFDAHFRAVSGYFAARGTSLDDALDLAQETFLQAYRGLDRFRGEASAKTWLFSIARNVWLSALRSRAAAKRDGVRVPLDEAHLPVAAGERSAGREGSQPLAGVLQRERVEQLREALAALPPQMRQCVMLRLFQGLRYREIAAVLRIAEATVKNHLFQAKRRLTALLEEYSTELEL